LNKRNFTHNSNFVFASNLFEDKEVEYFLQEVNLPGINFNHITTSVSAVPLVLQGDTPQYNDLMLSFILDEELILWKEIFKKLTLMRNPENSYGDNDEKWGNLIIQDDNSKEILKLEFHNLRIESVGDLEFNSNSEDEELTLSVTVKYDYFIILD